MTSKNSYFDLKLFNEACRRNVWVIALAFLVLFFALPVASMLLIQNNLNPDSTYLQTVLEEFLGVKNKFTTFVAVVGGIIASMTSFAYLHNKRKVDFYHSLPVKREKWFAVNYISGASFFIVPYFFMLLCTVMVITIMGYGSYLDMSNVIFTFFVNIIFYLMIFSLGVLCSMLSGKLVTTFALFCISSFICSGFLLLHFSYKELFYETYYYTFYNIGGLIKSMSPVLMAMMSGFNSDMPIMSDLPIAAALVVIFTAASIILYKKRSSEAAGKSVAFKMAKPIIKYPIVLVATLGMGIAFYYMGYELMGWMIFGFICGGAISHFIMEIIFNQDIKEMFKNVKGLCIFGVLFGLLILIPINDVTGFDAYIPESEKVESVSIRLPHTITSHYPDYDYESIGYRYGMDYEKRILERMTISDRAAIDAVLSIAKNNVDAKTLNLSKSDLSEYSYYSSIGIIYNLNDGRSVARKYSGFTTDDYLNACEVLFELPEFKQKFYPIFDLTEDASIRTYLFTHVDSMLMDENGVTSERLNIKPRYQWDIIQTLKEDLLSMKISDIRDTVPLYEIEIEHYDKEEDLNSTKKDYKYRNSYPVFASFEKTIGKLSEYGLLEDIPRTDELSIGNISKVVIGYIKEEIITDESVDEVNVKTYDSEPNEVEITNVEHIRLLLPALVHDVGVTYNPFLDNLENVWVHVYLKGEKDSARRYYIARNVLSDEALKILESYVEGFENLK